MDEKKYIEIVNRNKFKKKTIRNVLFSFLAGGIIGLINEAIFVLCTTNFNLDEDTSRAICAMVIILFASIATFFSFYNNLAQKVGAGLFLPTSGFANSLTSSAMEGRSEGLVQGIGGNIFLLAGSVISFGIFIATYFATIYYFLNLLGINVWA